MPAGKRLPPVSSRVYEAYCSLLRVSSWLGLAALSLLITCILACPPWAAAATTILASTDFGIRADGVEDDGPGIERMLATVSAANGPVRFVFPAGGRIRITTAPDRYVFRLENARNVTLDGQGSTFILGPDVRFLRVRHSNNISIRNLNIDFEPLPFVDGTVTAVNARERYVEVSVPAASAVLLQGGPTKQDGEQAFFGMLWHEGPYDLLGRHYWTARFADGPASGVVRVFAAENFKEFADIKPADWRISLPVPGIAHRFGPGACIDISDNDAVTMEDVELWSAPWFGVHVIRNRGPITFRRVHIRPKPGSGRLTSTWRDGFHVKGNSGPLLWEDCILSGMNDDAFNISTHTSRIRRIISPTTIEVLQRYPLNVMPWREGNTLAAADAKARIKLGTARIVKVTGSATQRTINGAPAASPVIIEIDRPIPGLDIDTLVWEPESANPDTTLRRCTIRNSCRFQSPVTLEACDVAAFLWFYGEGIEGPFPSNVIVRDCILRRGRGNPRLAVSFAGRVAGQRGSSVIHDVVFERNRVWGDLSMIGVDRVRFVDEQFLEPGARVNRQDCTDQR